MAETIDDLAERYSGQLPKREFERVREPLAARPPRPRRRGARTRSRPRGHRVARWRRRSCTRRSHAPTPRPGGFKTAPEEPSAEHLHEWRKRVKDLWYQQQLLEALWPEVMKAQAKEAKKLSKQLGEDHDLAVLTDVLRSDRRSTAKSCCPDREAPEAAAQADAQARAARLRRGPKHFARRVRRYVELV